MLKDKLLDVSRDCSQINCLGPLALISRVALVCNRELGFPTVRFHGEDSHVYFEYATKWITATLFTKTGNNGLYQVNVWLEAPNTRKRNKMAEAIQKGIHAELKDETLYDLVYLPFK